ncbi:MAG TPA: hypothetical protein VGC64_09570, partial [Pyrinomonadaceae bacterium]
MTQQDSNRPTVKPARRRGFRSALILQIIALIFAAVVTAHAQKGEQSGFTATPLYPASRIASSASAKRAALARGAKKSDVVNVVQAAACSPTVSIAPGTSPAGYLPLSSFGVPPVA